MNCARNSFSKISLLLPLLLVLANAVASIGAEFDHEHQAFTRVLKERVKDGRVDYGALKRDSSKLDDYLETLSAVKEGAFKSWNRERRLAFQINAYNAFTLRLILDHYPVDGIKSIGGWFTSPWELESVNLFGRRMTLDHLEHERLRKRYDEPRVHFALVCAAKGCPPLRAEAYAATDLDAQLDEQGRVFMRQSAKNRYEAGGKTLYLSPIFKWFREDFETDDHSLKEFVSRFFPEKTAKAVRADDVKVRFTDYDWSLNDQS